MGGDLQDWILQLTSDQWDELIIPGLATIYPEIAERWKLAIFNELASDGLKTLFCLLRNDHPSDIEIILNTYSQEELVELGYELDD